MDLFLPLASFSILNIIVLTIAEYVVAAETSTASLHLPKAFDFAFGCLFAA
jgi:hypothetical protein